MKKSILLTREQEIEDRVRRSADLFLTIPSATTRSVAEIVDSSKTTVHRDLRVRLPRIDPILSMRVAKKLGDNLEVRAERGGKASSGKKKHTR